MKMTGPPLVRGGRWGAINRILWRKKLGFGTNRKRNIVLRSLKCKIKTFLRLPLFFVFDCPKIPTFPKDLVETLMKVEQEKANKCN